MMGGRRPELTGEVEGVVSREKEGEVMAYWEEEEGNEGKSVQECQKSKEPSFRMANF